MIDGGEPVIDIERLGAWMDGVGLAGKGEPIEHRYLSGGTQNEIYEIRRGELHCAMRIPPPAAPASRDDGIFPFKPMAISRLAADGACR